MSKDTTIYTVVPKDGSPARLVEATSKAAVVHHLAAHLFDITPSTPKECVEATAAGVKVEVAVKVGPGGKPAVEPAAEPAQA